MGVPQKTRRIIRAGIRASLFVLLAIVSVAESENQGIAQEENKNSTSQKIQHKPKLDIYGDPLPPGAIARLGTIRLRHPSLLGVSVAISPDKAIIASGGTDKTARLWCTKTGKEIKRFEAPEMSMEVVAFSPNGEMLATGGSLGIIRLWDIATGKEIHRWDSKPQRGVYSLVFSGDGRFLAVGCTDYVHVWDVRDKTQTFSLNYQGNVKSIAFTANSKLLAMASDDPVSKSVRFWQIPPGKEVHEGIAFEQQVHSMSISPDGNNVAAVIWRDGLIIREIATGKEKLRIRDARSVVAFSPNGKSVVGIKDGKRVCLWDAATGNLLREFSGDHNRVGAVSFSRDGSLLATGGSGTIRMWDVSTGREKFPFRGHEGVPSKVNITHDGTGVMTGSSSGLYFWEIATGKLLSEFPVHVGVFSLRSDGHSFVQSNTTSLAVREIETRKLVWEKSMRGNPCWDCAFSPDKKSIVAGGGAESILVWDSSTGLVTRKLRWPATPRDQIAIGRLIEGKYLPLPQIQVLSFSGNGKFLAASGKGRNIHVWRFDDGEKCKRISLTPRPVAGYAEVNSLTMSSDGRFLAAGVSYDGAYVWNINSEKAIIRLAEGRCSVTALSPNGKCLATGGDKYVRLWEAETGQEICELSGHENQINSLCFSRDGQILVSTSSDQSALVWDLRQLPKLKGIVNGSGMTDPELAKYWTDLTKPDAIAAYRAIQTLRLHPERTVALLKTHLRPAPTPDIALIRKQIKNLDHDDFTIRENAHAELKKLGRMAEGELSSAREKELSDEHRQRINSLIDEMEKVALPPNHLSQTRAIQLLEYINTSEARQVLESIARGGAWAQTTQDALGALERMRLR